MKRNILKVLLTLVVSMVGINAFAEFERNSIEVNGISYFFDKLNGLAEVVQGVGGGYSGAIVIPSTVTYEDNTYRVKYIAERAFFNCKDVTSVTIPNSVIDISGEAFRGCGLSYVSIGNGVKNIESSAFKDCTSLTSVTIPNSVTTIGISAFSGCSSLSSITIGSGITNIPNSMFFNCTGLTSIEIPNNVESISDYAFKSCTNLSVVSFGNGLKSIGERAFACCSSLLSVTIPDNVDSIGEGAFAECTSLASVSIGCGVTSIASYAFADSGLLSITIPDNVTIVGPYTFAGCNNLLSVVIGNGVTTISEYLFNNCKKLTTVRIGSGVKCIEGFSFGGCAALKKVIVSDIAAWCSIDFKSTPLYVSHSLYSDENTEITDLVIPDGVTSISKGAFDECYGLTSVVIPNSVTTIGVIAFQDCLNLTSVTIGSNVVNIGSGAFRDCNNLRTIDIPSSVKTIGKGAFYNCENLNKVIVRDIAAWCSIAFENYEANPLFYSHHLYSDEDTEITELIIPDGVKEIGLYSFRGCNGLNSVTIPQSVSIIGRAFDGCDKLKKVIVKDIAAWCAVEFVPDFRSSVSSNPLYSAHHLYSDDNTEIIDLIIPEGVTTLAPYAFQGCNAFNSVTLPKSLKNIGAYSFLDCTSLLHVIIPDNVESLGDAAFASCTNLKSIDIGNSVTEIGDRVFVSCPNLTSVSVNINTPLKINSTTFSNRANATLYVPKGSKAAYEAADYWKEFKEIIEMSNPGGIATGAVEIDGIYYNLNSRAKSAKVTTNPNKYNGEVVIPDKVTYEEKEYSVKSIEAQAFQNCTELTSITIPNTVVGLEKQSFSGCTNLAFVSIPNSIEDLDYSTFENCSNIKKVEINSNAVLSKNRDWGTSIMYHVFGEQVEEYVLGESVKTIGESAFARCSGLTTITLPKSLKSIGAYALTYCGNLASIHIKDLASWCNVKMTNVISWNSLQLYLNDEEVNDLVIPDGVTTIGDYVFARYSNLTSVTIPSSVTKIGMSAFAGCYNVKSVYVTNLEVLWSADTSVGSGYKLYMNGEEVKKLVIPEGVKKVGNNAFANCFSLTSVTIPSTVTNIGAYAFIGCSELQSIKVAVGNAVYDSRESSNAIIDTAADSLIVGCKNSVIPNGVKKIGYDAFYGCTGLTSVTIPSSVTGIGEFAFSCPNLTTIVIGDGLKNIESFAFSGCYNVTNVYCYAKEVPSAPILYGNLVFAFSASATLHVPAASIEAYSSAESWEDFKNWGGIVALTDDDPKPTGIAKVSRDTTTDRQYYFLDGKRTMAPQRGLNIVKMKDGTMRKVVVK